ncbi:MAG: adenylate/guanylate cyclase domain-containing protein [Actinomycetota bacterium]
MSSKPSLPEDPRLAAVAKELERARGASLIFDADMTLVWVSDELYKLFHNPTPEELGVGKNLIEAYMTGKWSSAITLESQLTIFANDFPKLMYAMPGGKEELRGIFRFCLDEWEKLPELQLDPNLDLDELADQLFENLEPEEPPPFYTSVFEFVQGDLPPAKIVEFCVTLRDSKDGVIGGVITYAPALAATVMNLVARGDEELFGRMARLVEPGQRKAVVVFADLQSSALLSRRLPSGAYFKLIRAITTAMDEVVIRFKGIVGKHAGDGVSAFFLSDDLGSDSGAVRAAIGAAREITVAAATAAKQVGEETGLVESADTVVNVGVHWGGGLYMGQLVTGGRLEVTALGDNVNECARIQESARDGEVLGSKSLIEHLEPKDAAAIGIDPDRVVYRTVSELPGSTDKAKRDAGSIPVTVLNGD